MLPRPPPCCGWEGVGVDTGHLRSIKCLYHAGQNHPGGEAIEWPRTEWRRCMAVVAFYWSWWRQSSIRRRTRQPSLWLTSTTQYQRWSWQTVREGAPRRPTEASPQPPLPCWRSPLTPHRQPQTATPLQRGSDSVWGQQAHWSGTKEVGDNVAARHYLPPLWWRDPSITPRYPGLPDLIVTPGPAPAAARRLLLLLLLLLEISCWFWIGIRSADDLGVISVYRDIGWKTVSVVRLICQQV